MTFFVSKTISLILILNVLINYSEGEADGMNNDLQKLAKANNDLGIKLYHRLAKETSGNVFFSPFSISNAFGMLFAGARGNSAKQLRSVLGYDTAQISDSQVPQAFDQYLKKVLPENQPKDPAYTLNLANELLLEENFDVNPDYKEEITNLFHAYIKEVDFESNSNQIVQEVNNWVKEQTHGKIDKLLSSLDPSTVLLILNAIYFKGIWKTQFDKKQTKPQDFYNDGSDSKAKKVPLMHLTSKFPYTATNDLQALKLPYKGDNVSMIVLLPKQRDGLASLEESITPEKILSIQKQMYLTKVIVTFPKFKIDYEKQLKPEFKALGATDIFDPQSADLTGISESQGLDVSQVIHKAAIEVNEEGSEAAAATAIGIVATAAVLEPPPPPPRFTANHPFIYAIVDTRNDMMLFLGRVKEL